MKRFRYILLLVWLTLWGSVNLNAQSVSNYRLHSFVIDSLTNRIDTLSIIPNTFFVTNLKSTDYKLDYLTSKLIILDSTAVGKTITCHYRVFTLDLSKPQYHKSTNLILPNFIKDPTAQELVTFTPLTSNRLFDSNLQGTGSIARSIAVGNQQNLVLESNMNLQLSGTIAPDVEILANITDENLPIQPEGNTRYIKDFNKIFLQLKYKDLIKVTAGDIEMFTLQNPYFFKVSRQFTGVSVDVNTKIDSVNALTNQIGGGLSKGTFVRNQLTPIHGVQGPYRLTGAQGENNIVVLAGTERVYLDGILLTRGQHEDYTIDYNTGEITFTAKHLISRNNRIIVLFEYSNWNYSKYNLFTNNEFNHEKNNKLRLGVYFFHEQDLKNHPIQPDLTDAQKLFLASVGDIAANSYPSAVLVTDHSPAEILYHKSDTMVAGEYYQCVYSYAPTAHDSLYRVTFSFVGNGNGNYQLSQSLANGKVFQWVAPISGVKQGDYEPIILLNAPTMSDLLSVSADFSVSDKWSATTEIAFSYKDQNLFSKIGDANNTGIAYKLTTAYQTPISRRSKDSLWRYRLQFDYELVQKNFTPLETFRAIEHYRDYNLQNDYSTNATEQIVKMATGIEHPQKGSSYYIFSWLARPHSLTAIRNVLNSTHQINSWYWNSQTAFLFSNQLEENSRFLKTANDFSKSFAWLKMGIKEYLEYNVFRLPASDSLRLNSYAFNEAALYFTNSDSTRGYHYLLQYKNRIDNSLYNNVLSINSMAQEAQVAFEVSQWKHHRLKGTFTYRYDQVRDSLRHFQPEHNFVGNMDYFGKFWNGAVAIGAYYEVGSGLEQKKEFTFLKVAAGQGSYIWNDYNGNGIEELDEFELAVFQSEANYVKVWLATNHFVNTYNCGTTQTLQLRPANVWRKKDGFLKFLSLFSNSTLFRTYQKTTASNIVQSLNPFNFNLNDSLLVSRTLNVKNNFNFALPSSYFSLDYNILCNQSKNLLYYGLESNELRSHQVLARAVPVPIFILKTSYTYATKVNHSEGFSQRGYDIFAHTLSQEFTLNLKCNLSLALMGTASYKQNQTSTEKSNQYEIQFTADYRLKQRGTLHLRLHYINILYNGSIGNSISYEMLNGLTAGNNLLWNLTYQMQLFDYLQLNVQYEGRVTNDHRLIHTGLLQLKAFF